jgi:aspartate/methionine/tyrosine aminotransferase
VVKFTVARASHSVMPSFYSLAVAMAAYEMGFAQAAKTIIEPTNASRTVLKGVLEASGLQYILGKGYYAFMNVGDFVRAKGWADTEPLGQYLAENFGVAIVPGAFFSPFGGEWIRFSYATPAERTEGAFERMMAGLKSLK